MNKNILAAAKEQIIAAIKTVTDGILPIEVSATYTTDDGLEYGLLAKSEINPEGLVLLDLHNGPDTNPTEFPIEQMKASELAQILVDVTKQKEILQKKKRDELNDYMDRVADAVAEHYGHNVPYTASINQSELPWVLELLKERDERDLEKTHLNGEKYADIILDTCRFLASNGFLFPREMKEASLYDFEMYARAHEDEILDDIRKAYEDDWNEDWLAEDETEDKGEDPQRKAEEAMNLAMRDFGKNLPFFTADYNSDSDQLSIMMEPDTLGYSPTGAAITDERIEVYADEGFYKVFYETERGPFTGGGLLDGSSQEEIEKAAALYEGNCFYEKEPENLHIIFDACRRAGMYPKIIKLTYKDLLPF